MKGIVLLFIFSSILVGYLFFINKRKNKAISVPPIPKKADDGSKKKRQRAIADGECCGQHEVCEKDTLLVTQIQPEYYDDEELDAYQKRSASSYTDEEITQFDEIFSTLKDYDVAGWLKSLQIRGIELPFAIKAMIILQERRYKQ